jgi:hypothetical protein
VTRPRRSRLIATVGIVTLVLLAFAALKLSPAGPGPGLPTGATPLGLATEPGHLLPTNACPMALLLPTRIGTSGDQMTFASADTGDPVSVVWPAGWRAWRLDGEAVLVGRDGTVIGREGDVLPGYAGGVTDDGAFHVCIFGS